jgi:hypothetical protein
MHRSVRIAPLAIAAFMLASGASSVAWAESPVLTADCLNDLSACKEGGSALQPGEVRVRAVSSIGSDGTLLLTNRDLGLSSEELADKSAPEQPVEVARLEDSADESEAAPEAAEAATPGEQVDEPLDGAGEAVAPAPVVTSSEFTADESGVAEIEDPLDFDGCMERSIRAGNAFGESQRVCAAVFPE